VNEIILKKLYVDRKKSASSISAELGVSTTKVNYWLKKFGIKKRSISDAIYVKNNPLGDPFKFNKISNQKEATLFGIGMGLYWGEGTKRSTTSVRLGNSDPELIRVFIIFLRKIYSIDRKRLKFGLQIFQDIDSEKVLIFWSKYLKIPLSQFYKPIVTISNKKGNYTRKVEYGVLTIYFNNKKLRDVLVGEIHNIEKSLV
jgi:hypothetical protein